MMGSSTPNDSPYHGYPTPGPQSLTGQGVMDQVFFISELEWKEIQAEKKQFDYIVVGTGPCGYAVVERLLQKDPNCKILVLERGGYFLPDHFQNLSPAYGATVGDNTEIFPWTLTEETANGEYIKYQHGMVPFFGGRSVWWSSWCPRPTAEEFVGWPSEVIQSANNHMDSAESLLNVKPVSSLRLHVGTGRDVGDMSPVYDVLQNHLTAWIVDNLWEVPALTRAEAAPLAVGIPELTGIDFKKFATTGPFINLVQEQKDNGREESLRIVNNCRVEQISQNEEEKELKTSRGDLKVGKAKLVLATGTIPQATLIANSFPNVPNVGKHLSAHFISAIVARISVKDLGYGQLHDFELGAVYVAGIDGDYSKQFHIQLSAFHDKDPSAHARYTYEYAPDVLATASKAQLKDSEDSVVFVLACLGEIDVDNEQNGLSPNLAEVDVTANQLLNLTTSETDRHLWDVMEESAFELLEKIISKGGHMEYWKGTPDNGMWSEERPPKSQIRVSGTVHETCTLIIGKPNDERSSVGHDYQPHGVENVYVTGGGLWPKSGSWNPTLTMVALAQDLADKLANERQVEVDHEEGQQQ